MEVYIVFKHDDLEYKEVMGVYSTEDKALDLLEFFKEEDAHFWYKIETHKIK